MFSVPDILVVSVLALLLFGPDRLPKLMRQAGKFMREVQNTSHGFISEMERAADLAEHPVPPPAPYVPEPARYGDAAPSDIADYVEPDPVDLPEHDAAPHAEAPAAEPPANEHAERSSNEHPALRNPPLGGSAI
ncbi:MAG TPA: twin-arginine translocase TatA/TatE family subunit [Candidatus Acidoferrales bacterium]|jgi:TatA/E family protein of Tat protein translocase|nr:twin-arginine translocase TatA/TatE family subunit [Candidatus Acidoferrales bacterium]